MFKQLYFIIIFCQGKLWISLADYYIRKHQFDKARDIYEEAVKTVMTVRDFGQVRGEENTFQLL